MLHPAWFRPWRIGALGLAVLTLASTSNARAACPSGQTVTLDTAGQCCWPGQAWSRVQKACVGTPSACPAGLAPEGNGCSKVCPAGQSVTEDTRGNCCWAGQVFSAARQSCVGVPTQCPAGLVVQNEQCVQACPAGQLVTEDTRGQCCWPGQVFSSSRQACVGLPTSCPSGMIAEGESCGAPRAAPAPPEPPARAPLKSEVPPQVQPAPTAQPEPAQPPSPLPTRRKAGKVQREPEPEVEETDKTPRRVRISLVGGFFAGAGLGAGVGVPIRIALFRVLEGQPFQGLLALSLEPWIFGGVRAASGADYVSLGLAATVAAGWEQRLGPIELFPRVGVTNGLNFQAALAGSSNALFYLLRGLVGLRLAVPAGEGTKFLLGLDVHLGGEALWLAHIGVGF